MVRTKIYNTKLRNVKCTVCDLLQAVILVIMFTEAVTVMIRQESHFRVTRALRPVFLLDAHYCRGVRRLVIANRQLLISS
jgi:2-keto-4-pentenoate hydratase